MATNNMELFEEIARHNIQRKGLEDLLRMLRKTDFYTAPASTKYHSAFDGGLVAHSINVFNRLFGMKSEFTNNDESLAIVGLFHDICKIGYYTTEMRNSKVDGKWIQVPYYSVDDKFPIGHGDKSIIMLLQSGFDLTDNEMLAIKWHMGGFSPKEDYSTLGKAFAECPLALYLHLADMQATYYDEGFLKNSK